MFNMRDRVYIELFDNFDQHGKKFILLDNDALADVNFDPISAEGYGCAYHKTDMTDLLDTEFSGSLSNFYGYLQTQDKLRIYVPTMNDYAVMFARMVIELENDFSLPQSWADNFIEKREILQLLKFGQQVDFKSVYDAEKLTYTPLANLYNTSDISSLPLEVVVTLYQGGHISEAQANLKIASLSKSMLEAFVVGLGWKISHVLPRYPAILRDFTGDLTITTDVDVKNAIINNAFLEKLIMNRTVDVLTDLTNITNFLNAVFTHDPDSDGTSDATDFQKFLDLYSTNTMTMFMTNIQTYSESAFFESKNTKFNELLIFV